MVEQLTLGGGSEVVGKPPRRLGILYTGAACTLPLEDWRELDALTEHGPLTWPKGTEAAVFVLDPLSPAIEAQVRAWATRHRVKLWEGRIHNVSTKGLEDS